MSGAAPVRLRTGLALQLVGLLAAALGVLGVFVESQTRHGLVAQVDERVESALAQRLRNLDAPRPTATGTRDGYPPTATVILDTSGTVIEQRASGVDDVKDALPAVDAAWATVHRDRTATVAAVEGSLRYRARATTAPDGRTVVEAAPLRSADASVRDLRRTLLLGALAVLLLAALAMSILVGRSLQPLQRIAESAGVIAGGDLTHRVAVPTRYRELEQLGTSLDDMVRELTAAVATEAASRERLRRFTADASHELRTPITSLLGWAELHRMGGLRSDEELAAAMARMEKEARRMGRLVDDLLLLARADELQPRRATDVDLAAVCHDAIAAAEAIDAGHPVVLHVQGASSMEVLGDEDQLRQVADNLLGNVRAHTDPGTTATMSLRRDAGDIVLTVADDGPGFPPDALAHVFDRFWQATDQPGSTARSDTSRRRGHGLGLAIVQAITAAHGGTVTARNEHPHGAVITVRLPSTRSTKSSEH